MKLEPLASRHLMAGDLSVLQPIATSGQQVSESVDVAVTAESQHAVTTIAQHDSSDVNGDARITALDALLVINFLNKESFGEGDQAAASLDGEGLDEVTENPYDVNLDGRVSAVDALWVINIINETDASSRLGGCSCGGVGCPACFAPIIEWLPDSPEGIASQSVEVASVFVSNG